MPAQALACRAMIELPRRRARLLRPLFWTGIVVLTLGTLPLLVSIGVAKLQGDPNPNPVGPGILAMCTFWPGVALTLAGLFEGLLRWPFRRATDSKDDTTEPS